MNRQIFQAVVVGLLTSALFEFYVKPAIYKVKENAVQS